MRKAVPWPSDGTGTPSTNQLLTRTGRKTEIRRFNREKTRIKTVRTRSKPSPRRFPAIWQSFGSLLSPRKAVYMEDLYSLFGTKDANFRQQLDIFSRLEWQRRRRPNRRPRRPRRRLTSLRYVLSISLIQTQFSGGNPVRKSSKGLPAHWIWVSSSSRRSTAAWPNTPCPR